MTKEIPVTLPPYKVCSLRGNPWLKPITPAEELRRHALVDTGMRVCGFPILFRAIGVPDEEGEAEYTQDQLWMRPGACLADVLCRNPMARASWLTDQNFVAVAGQAEGHVWVLD